MRRGGNVVKFFEGPLLEWSKRGARKHAGVGRAGVEHAPGERGIRDAAAVDGTVPRGRPVALKNGPRRTRGARAAHNAQGQHGHRHDDSRSKSPGHGLVPTREVQPSFF